MIKKIGILFAAFGLSSISFGQYELSSFTSTGRGGATTFATDYQAVGINPANLGWTWKFEEKQVALGLSEGAYSLHSTALSKDELRTMGNTILTGGEFEDFTYDEKVQAAKSFTDEGFAFNADYGSIAGAYTGEELGGLGFRINDRFQWYSKLGGTASELLWMGYTAPYFDSLTIVSGSDTMNIANDTSQYDYDTTNIIKGFRDASNLQNFSQLLQGTDVQMNWYREYNISYGRKIFDIDSTFALYGGVGVKYLQGLAILGISAPNGELEAFSSISPAFDIDYGSAANSNPSTVKQDGFLPNSVGSGWGFDVGANAVLFNKIKIGVAMTNIGSITWTGNVYTVKDTVLYDTENEGLNNYNVAAQLGKIVGDEGMFVWEGEEARTVKLPTTFRFGASMRFTKKIQAGVDILMPTNEVPGSLEGALVGLGGDVMVLNWLRLSGGFITGGNYDFSIPLGLTVVTADGSYEAGIASRDAVTFFTQDGPTLSLALGFMRFRF